MRKLARGVVWMSHRRVVVASAKRSAEERWALRMYRGVRQRHGSTRGARTQAMQMAELIAKSGSDYFA